MPRYCIIGAGAAGISAIEQLHKAGYEVECFEKSDRAGGHWHTDYDALHLITSRNTTAFEDFPMPSDYPHFPSRDEVRRYIESYARVHGHYNVIDFNTEVTSIAPVETDGAIGSAGWTVTTSKGAAVYNGVLIANGHLWDPYIPYIPDHFTGKQIHSKYYRNVQNLGGDPVLVVGAGNSGCDLAVDVAQHRFDVDIVIREGIYFQCKTFFGRPRYELNFLDQSAPPEQDFIFRMLARISIGQAADYPNMPIPKHRTLAERRTVVNDLLPYWVHHGRIGIKPAIERLDGRLVHFADGSTGEYRTILWATGFRSSLPFLEDSLVPRRNGVPLRYAAGILPHGLEKLYYVGLAAPRGPQIPIYGIQAKVIARMMALHEQAGPSGADIAAYLGGLQEPEDRIDIVRDTWLDQWRDTERLLDALEQRLRQPITNARRQKGSEPDPQ